MLERSQSVNKARADRATGANQGEYPQIEARFPSGFA